VRLFLDSSVVLAACGRPVGASRRVIDLAPAMGWMLLTSAYVAAEVERNLAARLPPAARREWRRLRSGLERVPDILTLDRAALFASGKDRPVLFTAAAFGDGLLTLDRADFGALMASGFYGLPVLTPGAFLARERDAGRLPVDV